MNFNSEAVKIGILAVLSPFWWPFVRELWKEMDNALREEGGILGRPKSPAQEEAAKEYVSPLVSIPFRDPLSRRRADAGRASQPPESRPGGSPSRAQRSGFRRGR